MKTLIKLSLILLPFFANASSNEYKGNDTVVVSVTSEVDNLDLIKDAVSKSLKEKFGYELTIDQSMDNGCYNYLESCITKKDKPSVKGQGYLHDLYSMDSSPLQFSPEYFANGIIETVEEPDFSKYFEIFHPTKFWVTSKKVGDRYYLIISLN
jgi:hypothetical protein